MRRLTQRRTDKGHATMKKHDLTLRSGQDRRQRPRKAMSKSGGPKLYYKPHITTTVVFGTR